MTNETEGVIAALSESPSRLKDYFAQLGEEANIPFEDGWSAAEVLLHIRAADAIIAPRVMQILVRDNPPMPSWDERRWGEIWKAGDASLERQLAHFALGREQLISVLKHLTSDDWQLAGEHEKRGRQTIEEVVIGLFDHESEHVEQVATIVAAHKKRTAHHD